jgi:CsoR family transcriptional regulator, copper-sensing transcriptional repressor
MPQTRRRPQPPARTQPASRPAKACGSGCACSAGPGKAGPGVGPGAHALAVDPAIKDANLKHLRRIEGQIRGIAAMIEDDRYCTDIVTQVAAARESLHAVARNLLRNHLTHCAAQAFRAGGDATDDMVEELLQLLSKVAR